MFFFAGDGGGGLGRRSSERRVFCIPLPSRLVVSWSGTGMEIGVASLAYVYCRRVFVIAFTFVDLSRRDLALVVGYVKLRSESFVYVFT